MSLSNRADVLKKGTLRFMRNIIKKLFLCMFEQKRKRSKYTKMIQFKKHLVEFISKIGNFIDLESLNGSLNASTELIGRLINANLFNLLPSEFESKKSKEIQNMLQIYDRCCLNYSHQTFEHLLENAQFIAFIKLFNRLKKLNFLDSVSLKKITQKKYIEYSMQLCKDLDV